MTQRIAGFYSILDANDEALARLLLRPVTEGGAGARVLQVRIKSGKPVSTREILAAAQMARKVTQEAGALLIINDRLDIALAVTADGVHLGQGDLPLTQARELARKMAPNRRFLIGISTHNRDQVIEATRTGADYLGFGPVFPTATKANPDPVQGVASLREAVTLAGSTPVVAIGGITPENATEVAAAGAAAACSISAVNHVENQAVAGARINAVFTV